MGQEIRCRIIKLDVTEEDVVVDRRIVGEEEERAIKQRRYSEIIEGETVSGVVRSLTDYGAFVDIGGVDGLLHVAKSPGPASTSRRTCFRVGQQIEAKVLKVDADKQRISLGMKQLQPYPWDSVAEKYKVGERVRGTVTRVAEFGAFVELEPGIEGLIHVSEMSWSKKMKKASTIVDAGRERGCRDSGGERGRAPHLARPQASARRPVGRGDAQVSRGLGRSKARSPASPSSAPSCSFPMASRA